MAEHAPFAQPGDPAPRIGLDVFEDALLARLAGVPLGVGVEVVGVYLELYGPDGLERLRSTMGMSFVVQMVGHATLLPADQPT